MSEFTIHHHVSELITLLGVRSSDPIGEEVYTEKLLKSRTPYVTTQVSSSQAKKKIAESSNTPIEFLAKYDELKGKNVRDLDPLVYLLSKLCEEKETKQFLSKNAHEKAEQEGMTLMPHSKVTGQLPTAGTKMTEEELSEIKDILLKQAKVVENPSSDFLTKVMRDKQITRKVNIPQQPDWLFKRPYLTLDFMTIGDSTANENIVALGTMPTHYQEQAVLDDLLLLMRGIDGKYVIPRPLAESYAPREFLIDQSLDASVQELVKRILPLCSNYSTVVMFIKEKSSFEYGLVNHALSQAMETLIKDYLVLVAQLEQQMKLGQLTLQKLCFYLQPTMRILEILASIANSINRGKCIGGAVLSLLHEKTASMIGDGKSSELCLYLTQTACVPYMEIVEKWIYRGIILDPYSEFLVEENQTINKEKLQEDYNDAYWEKHYSVFQERIPVFLEQVADKILNTGKYLNVVRQCGRDVKCPFAEELVYTVKERRYYDQIERAYSYASRLLLTLLLEEKELMARLKSIKHYFLLDKGDFIVQFMDMTEVEMNLNIDDILPSRLESLLELALRTSTANVDTFKDDLRVDLLPFDLTTQLLQILAIDSKTEKEYRRDPTEIHLSGIESFSFDYVVKWPMSLVLSRKALTRYQILFRHLFYCKHVERQLCNVWIGNKQTKLYTISRSHCYSSAFALRQRMLNFIQNFEYYMMFEVIEPNWHTFQQNMSKVSNVDDVLALHGDFLDSCLKDCMLTSTELLRIVHKLQVVCILFSNYLQRVSQTITVESEMERLRDSSLQSSKSNRERKEDFQMKKTAAKIVSEHIDKVLADASFEEAILGFDKDFSRLLLELLDKIMDENNKTYEHKLFNIIYRLDFNGFYTEKLEAMSAERALKDHSFISESSAHSSASSGSLPTSFTTQHPEGARYVPGQYKGRKGSVPGSEK
ncbi:gamma-tubulin complex component 2-like isoform X2 [Physella acuta]|uniref:gamma-tubulin complex component 2-like isoform X2 n=1 Tax=Physella acuta TaxID=109671 RepID=UPI0027DDE280|nr:gamma-tubulin complex component 2-like isoform X2 [Physella acuta]